MMLRTSTTRATTIRTAAATITTNSNNNKVEITDVKEASSIITVKKIQGQFNTLLGPMRNKISGHY